MVTNGRPHARRCVHEHRPSKAVSSHTADEFAIGIYTATRNFPPEERYGVRSQIRRAAVAVPTNIVEGCARDSDREHARYFEIALGSAREALYLIGLSNRFGYLDQRVADELTVLGNRVGAPLTALKKSIS